MGIGDKAERSLALEVGRRRHRLDGAAEWIGPEEPVVRNHTRRGSALGGSIVVDREVQLWVREAGRRGPNRPGCPECAAGRKGRDEHRFSRGWIEYTDPLVAKVGDEPACERALDRRWRMGSSAGRASAACGREDQG